MELLVSHYKTDNETILKCIEEVAKKKKVKDEEVMSVVIASIYEPFLNLPQEIFEMIIFLLDVNSIAKICSSSRTVQERCGDRIWQVLFRRDISKHKFFPSKSWKENYFWIPKQTISAGNDIAGAIRGKRVYMWGFISLSHFGRNQGCEIFYNPVLVKIPSKSPPVQISVGYTFVGVVLKNGDLYTWGDWPDVQTLLNVRIYTSRPITKVNLPPVASISIGEHHMGAILKDGRLYMWGDNKHGALGDGSTNFTESPIHIKLPGRARHLSCGQQNTAVTLINGDLYLWGDNIHDQISLVSTGIKTTKVKTPVKSNLTDPVIQVSVGHSHIGAIIQKGTDRKILMWGSQNNARLGNGEYLYSMGISEVSEIKYPISLSCGHESTCAINENGDLYVWGSNNKEKLGFPSYSNPIILYPELISKAVFQASCGVDNTVILYRDGVVEEFGRGFKDASIDFS